MIVLFSFQFLQVNSLEVGGNCLAVNCTKLEEKCFERSDLELTINMEDNCKRLEYCSVNRDWDGVCKTKNSYLDPLRLYPGDPCVQKDYKTTCFFGLQRCGEDGKCMGVGLNRMCSSSADCAP